MDEAGQAGMYWEKLIYSFLGLYLCFTFYVRVRFLGLGYVTPSLKSAISPAKMIEQHIRHVIHHHRPEVERVIAVPLARARGRRYIVFVARILVTWKEAGGISMC